MHTNIGIDEENSKQTSLFLNTLLADEYVLYTKAKNAHWNVEGVDFFDKHLFFQKQYEQLDIIIDSVAERIRSLGHFAIASLKTFLEVTHLSEMRKYNTNDSSTYLEELLIDNESIIMHCRENINKINETYKDVGTADFVTQIMREHEKMAWLIRAHLK